MQHGYGATESCQCNSFRLGCCISLVSVRFSLRKHFFGRDCSFSHGSKESSRKKKEKCEEWVG